MKIMRSTILSGVIFAGILCNGGAVLAATPEEMAKQLQAMQETIKQLQAQLEQTQKRVAANEAAAAKKTTAEGKPVDDSVKIVMDPVPKFKSADGAYSFAVGGFVQTDAAFFDDDKRDYPDSAGFRRARLNVSGTFAKDFAYKFENDFGNNSSVVTDAYIQYKGFAPFTVTAGQFKEPFGLEQLTSDLYQTFVERASLTTFVPDRNIGVQLATHGENWTAALGGFGANGNTLSNDDESYGATGRLTYAPYADKENNAYLHLGVAGSYRVPDQASDTFGFSSKPLVGIVPSTALAVDTGKLSHVEGRELLGLEASFTYGPFSLQGEYMVAHLSRENGFQDATFDGYYLETTYFLTGETRNYNPAAGRYEMVKVLKPLSLKNGGWGAWQLMARYGNLNLNDGAVHGGEMQDISLGAKWYPHDRIRVMLDYTILDTDQHAVTANDNPGIWMMRTQFDF